MFGWFRRKTDREWIIREFRKAATEVHRSGAAEQTTFAIVLATYWKAFLSERGSPANFAKMPRAEQMEYYKKWLMLATSLRDAGDKEKFVPAEIISYYLAAIINEDRAFENEVAKFCDEYAQRAWGLV